MRLVSVHVTDFKSINDATPVHIEDGVTCLVGKNESGKTAFLEALYKLNPLEGKATKFDELLEYPRARRNEDRESISDRVPIVAVLRLEKSELQALEAELGKGCLESNEIFVERSYGDKLTFRFTLKESAIIQHLLAARGLDESHADGGATLAELKAKLGGIEASPPDTLVALRKDLDKFDPDAKALAKLVELLPKFLYFDNYSTLPGVFSIPYIQGRQRDQLDRNEVTAKALLQLAGVDVSEFTTAEYEKRRAALEA